MAGFQKLKLLYLMDIFNRETDEEHGLTLPEICSRLEQYDVCPDRKTLYGDFDLLRDYGLDIDKRTEGNQVRYYRISRDFELAELKLLVDAVQASKFISEKQSNELIGKLEKLCSVHEAKQLQRQVVVSGRTKAMSKTGIYSVDEIHKAINTNKRIRFVYHRWNTSKNLIPTRGGKIYDISPWALIWDDENYYLVGYDSEAQKLKHYRVDKMKDVEASDEPRDGRAEFEKLDFANYTQQVFGMFGGDRREVTIRGKSEKVGIIIDRFGRNIWLHTDPEDREYFTAKVTVAVSDQFLGWMMAIGEDFTITGPDDVVATMQGKIEQLRKQYHAD